MTQDLAEGVASRPPRGGGSGAPSDVELPRMLGAFTLAAYFVAFCAPLAVLAGWLQPVIAFGNGVGAPVAFLGAGLLVLVFQIGCLAMGRNMAHPGPFYSYVATGLGKVAGLPASLLALAAYLCFSIASYVYLGLITEHLMVELFGVTVMSWKLWGALGLLLIGLLNLLRIDISARVVVVGVVLEVVIVAVYQAVVFVRGGEGGYSASSFNPTEFLSGSPGIAMLFALTTLVGMEAMAVFRGEVKDPEKTIPRAAYGAITFTTIFFALAAWAYIVAVNPANAIDEARNAPVDSFFATITVYLGGTVSTLTSVLLVTSQLAAANSCQASAIRYLYALGRDGVLPKPLALVHPRLKSPYVATLTSIAICVSAYLVLTRRDDVILIYGTVGGFGTLCLLVLLLGTCAAIIRFFQQGEYSEVNVGQTLVAPIVAFVGFATVLVLAISNAELMLGSSTAGVICTTSLAVVVSVGVAAALVLRKNRPEVYERIGGQLD